MQKEKCVTITFRIRESVHKRVKEIAAQEGVSLNAALHQRVVRDLVNEERRNIDVQ